MELKEVYELAQGNYDEAIKRLRSEDRIKKYLLKFLDKDMAVVIRNALDAEEYETAFREAHNLKGVCANLNLDKLEMSAAALTEALRGGEPKGDVNALADSMQSDYEMTVHALNHLK